MKMKNVIFAMCVFGAFEINTIFKTTIPCAFKKITNMAGVAELVEMYGYKVHKCSHSEFVANKKEIHKMDYTEHIISNTKNVPAKKEEISIKIDLLPSMEYMIRAKHEHYSSVFDEEIVDVYQRTAILDGFDRVVSIIENFLNNQ